MSTPGAEDASNSSEDYSGDQDGSDMAEQKQDEQADDASPDQRAATQQKPQSNAKDPLRPRRKKARRACFACQRAHLTCGDERPCERCVKRGLQESCVDGVRKKAKYLHDAPDAALRPPGLGPSYPHINRGHHPAMPGQDIGPVALHHQMYTQPPPPPAAYYAQNPGQPHAPLSAHESPIGPPFSNPQPPISPPYTQANQPPLSNVPAASQGGPAQMQQFGGPLFDPSDPALFNFDISSLNFGNHYGALEMGMLGHMSSGAADTPPNEANLMNPLNQAAGMYNQQMSYGENPNMHSVSYDANGLPRQGWQNHHSRQGSLQMQTPNNTPVTANLDHVNHRQDSLHGPPAFSIGHGPPSLSSESPASTDVNAAYDTDHTMSGTPFYHNAGQPQMHQHSPATHRVQQENRIPGTALQPIPSNVIRKRRRDTKWIYEGIRKPHDYVRAFHRMTAFFGRRYKNKATVERVRTAMSKYRPVLITNAERLNPEDLIHQEQALQLSLIQIEECFSEVGVPSIVCRRSGEVVWMNNEFSILTNWDRDVLLGHKPNLNVNTGIAPDPNGENRMLNRSNTITPTITGQDGNSGPDYPVLIIELMDERSAVEYLDDFAETAYSDSRGTPRRRVNMLKYRTKEDVAEYEAKMAHVKAANGRHGNQHHNANANAKPDIPIKMEGGPVVHRGESQLKKLGEKDGLVDCMIQWHVKRDNFDMPMLVCMHVLPVLDPSPGRVLLER